MELVHYCIPICNLNRSIKFTSQINLISPKFGPFDSTAACWSLYAKFAYFDCLYSMRWSYT